MGVLRLRGFEIYKGHLPLQQQHALVEALRPVLREAPLFRATIPGGGKMSVRMTSAGDYGWYADESGYRYEPKHPKGTVWPAIPQELLDIWDEVTGIERRPESCLINYYSEGARMRLHLDRDEADFSYPVVSVSLGDDGLFKFGGRQRSDKVDSMWINSGDVVVMGGEARLAYHGVDRIRFQSSRLLPKGGRINLTLRMVT